MLRPGLLASFAALTLASAPSAAHQAEEYAAAGPHGVGVRTVTLTDTSRPTMALGSYPGDPDKRVLTTEVWYPADVDPGAAPVRDAAPSAGGPWPLLLRAHGLGAHRRDAAYLTEHLASHGYVVVAPDFPLSKATTPALLPTSFDVDEQATDLAFVADQAIDATAPLDFLDGRVDVARLGTVGHSLGGLTVLLGGWHEDLRDPRVRAVAALVPWGCALQEDFFAGSTLPSLWMGGTDDLITPYVDNQEKPFPRANAPRVLATLSDATHVFFSTSLTELEEGENPDDALCERTRGFLPRPFPMPGLPEDLGGKAKGIDTGTCGKICPQYSGTFLEEARHHDLVKAAVLAFFEAEMRGSPEAHEALVSGMAEEPEVETEEVEGECAFGSCQWKDTCAACGQPVTLDGAGPKAADALFVLRTAVGIGDGCPTCICDVNASLAVSAPDALAVLRRAVGFSGEMACLRPAPVVVED